MQALLERLRARDWRLTAQRRVVAEVLAGDHVHMTADEIQAAAAERLPEISRATVYNVLRELVTLGEIREVVLDGRARLYDPNPDTTHHHLACDECGAVVDVYLGEPPRLASDQTHQYDVDRVDIVYHGRCPHCRARA